MSECLQKRILDFKNYSSSDIMTFDFSKLHSLLSQSMGKNHENISCENSNSEDDNVSDVIGKIEKEESSPRPIPHEIGEEECSRTCYADRSDTLSENDIEFNINSLTALLLWNIRHIGVEKHEFHLCKEILMTLINILNRTVEIMKQEKNCMDPVVWEVINPDNGPIVSFKYFQFHSKNTSFKVIKKEPVDVESKEHRIKAKATKTNTDPVFQSDPEFIDLNHQNEFLIPVEGKIVNEIYEYRTSDGITQNKLNVHEENLIIAENSNSLVNSQKFDSLHLKTQLVKPKFKKCKTLIKKSIQGKLQRCAVCHRTFANDSVFKLHTSKHRALRRFQCSFCYKRFRTINLLRNHVFIHRISAKNLQRISYFKKETLKRTQNEVDLSLVQKRINRISSTVNSKYVTSNRGNITRLNGDRNLVKSKYNLEKNKIQVHNILDTKKSLQQCRFCHESFRHRHDLIQHERIHFTSPKTHKCDKCDKIFTTNCDLEKHHSSHRVEKIHSCALCTQHRISCKGTNPFSAEITSKHSSCTNHVNTLDYMTGKTYSCDICFKIFTTGCELQCHKYFHENGKQPSCSKCIQTRMSA